MTKKEYITLAKSRVLRGLSFIKGALSKIDINTEILDITNPNLCVIGQAYNRNFDEVTDEWPMESIVWNGFMNDYQEAKTLLDFSEVGVALDWMNEQLTLLWKEALTNERLGVL